MRAIQALLVLSIINPCRVFVIGFESDKIMNPEHLT
jgi:hypothetical protein